MKNTGKNSITLSKAPVKKKVLFFLSFTDHKSIFLFKSITRFLELSLRFIWN